MARKKADPIDAEIEKEYYKQAQGKTIDIMSIGSFYADCRAAIKAGTPLVDAVKAGVAKYCQEAK